MIEARTNQEDTSKAFFESIFENIPNMIFIKDAKGLRFVRFNKAGEELLGYKKEDLIGKNDYDFFPKKEADFFTLKDRKVLEEKVVLDIPEEPIQTKNGPRILHTKKIPLLDSNGKALYLLGISEDITEKKERKELEAVNQQLRAANQQLDASVQQLRAANQQLKTLEQTLRERIGELEVLNKATVSRELKMIALKKEIKDLHTHEEKV